MSKPVLSWDDFDEDLSIKTAVSQDIALKAAQSIATMDTTEAEKELDQQGAAIKHNQALKEAGLAINGGGSQPTLNPSASFTPSGLKVTNQAMLEKAMKIIETMNAHLEQGGRVDVSEKYLLNCKADLNQLVPFKYNWAWSLYLTSCENHWMPAELGMEKAVEAFKDIKKGTPRIMLAKFYMNYQYRQHSFNNTVLLNIYRILTNPECRQYILREGFENCAIIHAMTDFKELFNPTAIEFGGKNLSLNQWLIDGDTFKSRHRKMIELTPSCRDLEFMTTGEENTIKFLEELIYLYGWTNWIMNIIPIYQLINALHIEGKGLELKTLCSRLIRDMQSQTSFITLFLSTAFDENQFVLTDDFKERVNKNFKKIFDLEYDLVTVASTDTETKDVTEVVKYFIAQFLNSIGIESKLQGQLNDNNVWFANWVNELKPHVNHEAGLSGNGGSLGW